MKVNINSGKLAMLHTRETVLPRREAERISEVANQKVITGSRGALYDGDKLIMELEGPITLIYTPDDDLPTRLEGSE